MVKVLGSSTCNSGAHPTSFLLLFSQCRSAAVSLLLLPVVWPLCWFSPWVLGRCAVTSPVCLASLSVLPVGAGPLCCCCPWLSGLCIGSPRGCWAAVLVLPLYWLVVLFLLAVVSLPLCCYCPLCLAVLSGCFSCWCRAATHGAIRYCCLSTPECALKSK